MIGCVVGLVFILDKVSVFSRFGDNLGYMYLGGRVSFEKKYWIKRFGLSFSLMVFRILVLGYFLFFGFLEFLFVDGNWISLVSLVFFVLRESVFEV